MSLGTWARKAAYDLIETFYLVRDGPVKRKNLVLEKKLEETGSQLAALRQDYDLASQQIADSEKKYSFLLSQYHDLEARAASLSSQVIELGSRNREIQEHLDANRAAIGHVKEANKQYRASLAALCSRGPLLDQRVQKIHSSKVFAKRPVLVLDNSGKVVYANKLALASLRERKPETKIIGSNYELFFPIVYHDEIKKAIKYGGKTSININFSDPGKEPNVRVRFISSYFSVPIQGDPEKYPICTIIAIDPKIKHKVLFRRTRKLLKDAKAAFTRKDEQSKTTNPTQAPNSLQSIISVPKELARI